MFANEYCKVLAKKSTKQAESGKIAEKAKPEENVEN